MTKDLAALARLTTWAAHVTERAARNGGVLLPRDRKIAERVLTAFENKPKRLSTVVRVLLDCVAAFKGRKASARTLRSYIEFRFEDLCFALPPRPETDRVAAFELFETIVMNLRADAVADGYRADVIDLARMFGIDAKSKANVGTKFNEERERRASSGLP